MNINELKYAVEGYAKRAEGHPERALTVVIPIETVQGRVGPMPYIEVESVYLGSDWDKGKVFIKPAEKLSIAPMEEILRMREHCDKVLAENFRLKAEVKRLKRTQIKLL